MAYYIQKPYQYRPQKAPARCGACGKVGFQNTNEASAYVASKRRRDPRGSYRVYWYRCGKHLHITKASEDFEGHKNKELRVRMW